MNTTAEAGKDVIKLLNDLISLDFDAIAAYDAAVERLEDRDAQDTLRGFRVDHKRHTEDLAQVVRGMGQTPPNSGDVMQILTKGKVVLGGLIGDHTILMAMKSNEEDTNTAYEKAVSHPNLAENVRQLLAKNLADERRHRAWIEKRLQGPEALQSTPR